MAVYEVKLSDVVEYKRVESVKEVPFSNEEKECVVKKWSEFRKGTYFNSGVVTLVSVRKCCGTMILTLAKTDFYSLLITNVIRPQIAQFSKQWDCEDELLQKLQNYYAGFVKEYSDFEDLITNQIVSDE